MKNSIKITILTFVMINLFTTKIFSLTPNTTLDLTFLLQGFYDQNTNLMSKPIDVVVSLHNSASPYELVNLVYTIVNINGSNPEINFTIPATGSYYIAIANWNMIETWSKLPVTFSINGTTTYDFSTSQNQAFGDNLIRIDNEVKFGMYVGDINQNGIIGIEDAGALSNDFYNNLTGNIITDLTGDEILDLDDLLIMTNNATSFVSSLHP